MARCRVTSHCPVEYPATREDPGYGCEEEVENDGDFCRAHEPVDDGYAYDLWKDERRGL